MWRCMLGLLGAVAALWPSNQPAPFFYLATAATTSSDTVDEILMKRLNLWIDGKEIEQFVGVAMDIFVIREGVVVHYLQDAYLDQQLPVLPPDVHVVRLTWQATDDLYKYTFSHLRSLDPRTLYNPLLSIPSEGYISIQRSDFQVTIPCTGQVTAIASMYIVLHIEDSRGKPIPGSPIKLHLRKRCIAFEGRTICQFECKNGGSCSSRGQCECKKGYYGQQCQLAACLPECQNNGTCISPRQCQCMEGYVGDFCQTPICRRPCQNGGTCIQPQKCECHRSYYGNYCEHVSGNCRIPCKNGGTCTRDNQCACPKGYVGEFCQKPTCRRSCGINGRCVDIDVCACYRGWRGKFCHKTVNRFPAHERYERIRKKRRKSDRALTHGGHWNSRRERRRQLRKRDDRRRRHSGGH